MVAGTQFQGSLSVRPGRQSYTQEGMFKTLFFFCLLNSKLSMLKPEIYHELAMMAIIRARNLSELLTFTYEFSDENFTYEFSTGNEMK